MKLASAACASFVVVAALALSAEGAAGRVIHDHSVTVGLKVSPDTPTKVKQCTGLNGRILVDPKLGTICALPGLDANANARACADLHGKFSVDPQYGQICALPPAVAAPAAAGYGTGDHYSVVPQQGREVALGGPDTSERSQLKPAKGFAPLKPAEFDAARTDGQRGVWKAPAGKTCTDSDKPVATIADYNEACARAGQTPLDGASRKYVPVRRLAYKLNPNDPNAAEACLKAHGAITKNNNGEAICSEP